MATTRPQDFQLTSTEIISQYASEIASLNPKYGVQEIVFKYNPHAVRHIYMPFEFKSGTDFLTWINDHPGLHDEILIALKSHYNFRNAPLPKQNNRLQNERINLRTFLSTIGPILSGLSGNMATNLIIEFNAKCARNGTQKSFNFSNKSGSDLFLMINQCQDPEAKLFVDVLYEHGVLKDAPLIDMSFEKQVAQAPQQRKNKLRKFLREVSPSICNFSDNVVLHIRLYFNSKVQNHVFITHLSSGAELLEWLNTHEDIHVKLFFKTIKEHGYSLNKKIPEDIFSDSQQEQDTDLELALKLSLEEQALREKFDAVKTPKPIINVNQPNIKASLSEPSPVKPSFNSSSSLMQSVLQQQKDLYNSVNRPVEVKQPEIKPVEVKPAEAKSIGVEIEIEEKYFHRNIAAQYPEITKDNHPALKNYLDTFEGKLKYSHVLNKIPLTDSDKEQLDDCMDNFIEMDFADLPVTLNGNTFNLPSLLGVLKQNGLDPVNGYAFTLRDIQPGLSQKKKVEKFVEHHKDNSAKQVSEPEGNKQFSFGHK